MRELCVKTEDECDKSKFNECKTKLHLMLNKKMCKIVNKST